MKHYVFIPLLVGCSWMGRAAPGDGVSIEPPGFAKGDIELVFSNSTDRPICELHIDQASAPLGPNWIHGGMVANGASKYAHVKAGAYHVVIDSCEKGKYHHEADMTIARRTELTLTFQKYVDERRGPTSRNTDVFDAIVEAPDYILHPAACVRDEQPTQTNGAECCAAAYHTNPGGVRVCGA